jgi:hypothetical protein
MGDHFDSIALREVLREYDRYSLFFCADRPVSSAGYDFSP